MLNYWLPYVRNLLRPFGDQKGQDLAEYGLLSALIAVVCIVAIGLLGGQLKTLWEYVATVMH